MIDILMATYNGDLYLAQQIESIIGQSYTDWRLIVRDDCSHDNTMSVLKKYQEQYPEKIIIIPSKHPSGSAMNNFFKLLDYADSEYIMFSDQDDVWKKDKIAVAVSKMHELEKQYGVEVPLLVHTDLCVVDENLQTINPSIFAMQNMDPTRDKLNHLLATNIVTGCTMLFNQALLKLLVEKPKTAVMHDMWIALVAAAFGKIGFVDKATMFYRQHSTNANGTKNVKSFNYIKDAINNIDSISESLDLHYEQASEFLKIYKGNLNKEQIELLSGYSEFRQKNWLQRGFFLFRKDINKKGLARICGQIFC